MSSPPSAARHSLCLQPDSGGPPELGSSPPVLCSNSSSLGSSTPTGAACAPGDYGRQALSPAEAEKRSGGKRKSDSSGKSAPGTAGERGRGKDREASGATVRRRGTGYESRPLWLPAAKFGGGCFGPVIWGHVFPSKGNTAANSDKLSKVQTSLPEG